MNINKSTLRKRPKGNGHFKVSVEIDGNELSTITTNTMAIDAAFDENYNDDTTGKYYSSREEAQYDLINEIVRKN